MKALVVVAVLATPALALAEPLRAVSSDIRTTCAIDTSGVVRCTEGPTPVLEKRAVALAIPYVVTEDGGLVYWNTSSGDVSPEKPPFAVRSVATTESRPCILGPKGELACQQDGTFTRIEPKRTFVSIESGGESLWALDKAGGLWCLGRGNCARLKIAMTKAKAKTLLDRGVRDAYPSGVSYPDAVPLWRVATGVAHYYPQNEMCFESKGSGSLVCWDWVLGPQTMPRPAGDELAVVGTYVCARAGDTVTCTSVELVDAIRPSKPEVHTVVVKNARRLHGSGYKLCIEDANAELTCSAGIVELAKFERAKLQVFTKKE